ncbi:MAG: hypothetical protein JNL58_08095 [Planctomyces sp.]|nr:hypothetical protein [Planctomyces sp.]
MTNTEQHRPNFAALLLIGVLVFMGWNWIKSQPNTPKPDQPKPVPAETRSELEVASSEETEALRRHLRDCVDKLGSGQLTEERATRDFIAAGRKAATEAAWLPVKQKDVTAFKDGWTAEKQIARLKSMLGE